MNGTKTTDTLLQIIDSLIYYAQMLIYPLIAYYNMPNYWTYSKLNGLPSANKAVGWQPNTNLALRAKLRVQINWQRATTQEIPDAVRYWCILSNPDYAKVQRINRFYWQ